MASGDIHTKPANDLIEHEAKEYCICGPECIPIEMEDGSIIYQWVHHSLDGRELVESER